MAVNVTVVSPPTVNSIETLTTPGEAPASKDFVGAVFSVAPVAGTKTVALGGGGSLTVTLTPELKALRPALEA